MDTQTIVIAVIGLAVVLLAVKKFKGGCCGGKKEGTSGEGEKHDHGDGSCCGHKH